MSSLLFPPRALPRLSVMGETACYSVSRIFCVGRNYAAHAEEMGGTVDREAPWYFTKSAFSACSSGATVPYPPGTQNYHHEMELVVALGTSVFRADQDKAGAAVFGYGCGFDMTRRDLQQQGKDHRRPWDLGKDVESGAVLGPLTPVFAAGDLGPKRIQLWVNGDIRQDATLDDMVWSVPEIISHLSQYYHLGPGDVIMTGTPAGVGPVEPGNRIVGAITGLSDITLTLGPPE